MNEAAFRGSRFLGMVAFLHMASVLYEDTFRKHPFVFVEALEAQGISVPGGQVSEEALQEHYDALLQALVTPRSHTKTDCVRRDLLRDAFMFAQVDLAAYDCRPVRSENSLTGSLYTRLSVAVQRVHDYTCRVASYSRETIGLWSLELINARREQRLGGDIAFVLEGDRGLSAVCLQAKRADPKVDRLGSAKEDIRQDKHVLDRVARSLIGGDPF